MGLSISDATQEVITSRQTCVYTAHKQVQKNWTKDNTRVAL